MKGNVKENDRDPGDRNTDNQRNSDKKGAAEAPSKDREKPTLGQTAVASGRNVPSSAAPVPLSAPVPPSGQGGGGHRFISPNFKVSPATGTMSLSLPVQTSEGRSRFPLHLSLSYDSGCGNGPFGFGWQLSAGSISRKISDRVPLYDGSDIFVFSETEDLVPYSKENAAEIEYDGCKYRICRYRPRVEREELRIECWINKDDISDIQWRVIDGENVTTVFGETDASRIFDTPSNNNKRIFSWLKSKTYDAKGNAVEFCYKPEDAQDEVRGSATNMYLKFIKYGNRTPNRDTSNWSKLLQIPAKDWLFEVVFDYGEHDKGAPSCAEISTWTTRQDVFSSYRSGFDIRTYRLCERILMFHHMPEKLGYDDCLVGSTVLGYETSVTGSFLTSFQYIGYSGNAKNQLALPPCHFEYSQMPDFSKSNLEKFRSSNLPTLPGLGSQIGKAEWLDLDCEGSIGVLHQSRSGDWSFQRNINALSGYDNNNNSTATTQQPGIENPKYLQYVPQIPSETAYFFEDLDRNGKTDIVCCNKDGEINGYYEKSSNFDGWSEFKEFESVPPVNLLTDERLKRIDLTGDGLHDLMFVDKDSNDVVWHKSLAKAGFGAENRHYMSQTPKILESDQCSAIILADMSGDGLIDVVEITDSRVCYWPNMGHGKFGAKMFMENAPEIRPRTAFDIKRIHPLDVDGSGTTDLIYAPPEGGLYLYLNQAGNRWSDRIHIKSFPRMESGDSIFTADLLGRGTSCICFATEDAAAGGERKVYFLELASKIKPHLMTSFSNGIGGTTKISYRPSTYYYLKDERNGQKWGTKIPFPVHCVSQIEEMDFVVDNVFKTKYEYHEGFYDAIEREFRGFGVVDELHYENFCISSDRSFSSVPKHTKTWYHTGCQVYKAPIEEPYSCKYKLPEDAQSEEHYDIYRALKGEILRHKVYALDGTAKSGLPYIVENTSLQIVRVKSAFNTQHGIYKILPYDSLTVHCERESPTPRVERSIVLEVNLFGQVTQSALIHYGRAATALKDIAGRSQLTSIEAEAENALSLESQKQQTETIIEYKIASYTKAVTADQTNFRTPLVQSSQTFRIKCGASPALESNPHQLLQTNNFAFMRETPTIRDIFSVSDGTSCKCLTHEERNFYLSSNLKERLDPQTGDIEAFSILDQSFTKVLQGESFVSAYGNDADAIKNKFNVDIWKDGGFFDLDGDKSLWQASAKYRFHKDDDRSSRLAYARSSFYTPLVEFDCFNNSSISKLDDYCLLLKSITDAVDNQTTYENDYESLCARQVTDRNGNCQFFAFDALGRTCATALCGKAEENLGDSLDGLAPLPSDGRLIDFLSNLNYKAAKDIIGDASEITLYCMSSFIDKPKDAKPMQNFTLEMQRDKHKSETDTPALHIQLNYLDGGDRPMQTVKLEQPLLPSSKDLIWVVEDWAIHDKDEQVVRTIKPFKQNSYTAVQKVDKGHFTTTFLRDPLDRLICSINPDKTWSKTSYFPWSEVHWDEGDTVMINDSKQDDDVGAAVALLDRYSYFPSWYSDSISSSTANQVEAARKSQVYANTPHFNYFDSTALRIQETVKVQKSSHTERTTYDVAGRVAALHDRLDRVAAVRKYDMLDRPLYEGTMDKGEKWVIYDARMNPFLSWDDNDFRQREVYDGANRSTRSWVGERCLPGILYSEKTYGESTHGEEIPAAKASDDMRLNLRGQLVSVQDQSGSSKFSRFDLKGNCVEAEYQMAKNYRSLVDWNKKQEMEPKIYESKFSFDALSRVVKEVNVLGEIVECIYGTGETVKSISHKTSEKETSQSIVQNIEYDAEGKILKIEYGNYTTTAYEYDPASSTKVGRSTQDASKKMIEDVKYWVDIMQRKTTTQDFAQDYVFFRQSKIDTSKTYTYDAEGQLESCSGREQVDARNGEARHSRPYTGGKYEKYESRGGDRQLCGYIEKYQYDIAGNIMSLTHETDDPRVQGWTRKYFYDGERPLSDNGFCRIGNRLLRTTVGTSSIEENYKYNNHGCVTSMPGISKMCWDHLQKLRSLSTQKVKEGSVPETTWYVYNWEGERVRKVTESSASNSLTAVKIRDSVYLQGCELSIKYLGDGVTVKKRTSTSSISAGSNMDVMCQIEVTVKDKEISTITRFRVGDNFEIDGDGNVISYEEYSPFGVTTYRASSSGISAPRKYRFASYERDKESRFYFAQARYYAPWLGRWLSPDPVGHIDGFNLYRYVRNDPTNLVDPSGTNPDSSEEEKKGSPPPKKKDKKSKNNHNDSSDYGQEPNQPKSRIAHRKKPNTSLNESRNPLDNSSASLIGREPSRKTEKKANNVQNELERGRVHGQEASKSMRKEFKSQIRNQRERSPDRSRDVPREPTNQVTRRHVTNINATRIQVQPASNLQPNVIQQQGGVAINIPVNNNNNNVNNNNQVVNQQPLQGGAPINPAPGNPVQGRFWTRNRILFAINIGALVLQAGGLALQWYYAAKDCKKNV